MATFTERFTKGAYPIHSVAEAVKPGPQGVDLYSRFFLAGALCCSITHGAVTPIDVVKTRIQLEPTVYNKGMMAGGFKFGGYELFKKVLVSQMDNETAVKNRMAIYLGASAIAEFFADIALCPLEATRIRLVSQPTFANGLAPAFLRIAREEGLGGFYAGFGPILFKQIPYNMAKFATMEVVLEKAIQTYGKPKSELSGGEATFLNLGSGLIAGFAAATISQPADTLLSKINKQKALPGETITGRITKMAGELGVRGLFGGLTTRLVMVGSITAGQFAIYGELKRALGATNTVEISKA
ncbi:probable phosphate transport protein MIR1 [Ustilago trichophora]|uniref:Probable phosphate transport protein MIR1 n=1 Tax=Ustilago trichophora TaxID=86804 RepID=A0A5C3E959_9BASI|nr:probable phosphate transport protein MIR1 [Ustilago trichophora]